MGTVIATRSEMRGRAARPAALPIAASDPEWAYSPPPAAP